jgi:indole-3-glycerol phosphate synthase
MELAKFRAAKAAEIARLKKNPPKPGATARPDFLGSLRAGAQKRGLGLIAEYKRASPSRGDLNLALAPEEAAAAYAAAEAVSVLTEETYFKGSLSYLGALAQNGRPVLRKDFIFDPLQVLETAATLAAAVLLIVRLTPEPSLLAELIALARAEGLVPVVEVFGPADLELARKAGAKVIQANARDLETLRVDLAGPLKLIKDYPPLGDEFWIAASGLATAQDLRERRAAGFGAALIGSALMGSGSPQGALSKLLREFEDFNLS